MNQTILSESLIYQVDDRPPLLRNLLYGIQWTVIFIPVLVFTVSICSKAIGLDETGQILFSQRILFVTGVATLLQSLIGHRYPIQEGPATALILSVITLGPYGLLAIEGGMIVGGCFLFLLGSFRLVRWITPFFTDRVVGVILMLIAFTLLPFLYRLVGGIDPKHPSGDLTVFLTSLSLILLICLFSHWLRGFLKTISIFLGVLIGFFVFLITGRVDFTTLGESVWLSSPSDLIIGPPRFILPSVITFLFAYLAVIVNSLGSIYGVSEIVGKDQIEERINRGIALTGIGGILAGLTGAIGTVGYSISPGVVLVSRVGSRFSLTMCGGILVILSLVPKLGALFVAIPASVVGAAFCVALASQVGAGIAVITKGKEPLTARDYLVVGVPTLLGTIIAFLPREIYAPLPGVLSAVLANGVVFGIIMVMILEHLLLRQHRSEG
jgi:uracil permease